MKFSELLQESLGYTSSENIAASLGGPADIKRQRVSRAGDLDWHNSIKADMEYRNSPEAKLQAKARESLALAREKLNKKKKFFNRLKDFLEARSMRRQFRISESFDMNDVVSRLSSLEGVDREQTVTYGVEDDSGNLMKVTVRAEQAEEFEQRLAQELADALRVKDITEKNAGISMAELLYNLNNEFDIVDVQFPQIPKDAIYNADKVQYGIADTAKEDIQSEPPDDFEQSFGMESDPNLGTGEDVSAVEDDTLGLGDEFADEDKMVDDESVKEFPVEDETPPSESNILSSILDMLKSEAEARRAEAEARAEEARARQAEYTAIATQKAVEEQEELARMEAEIERQKKQEKEARRLADLAKYRVRKANSFSSFGESKTKFSDFLTRLTEADDFDTIASLNRERANVRVKYAPQPDDEPEVVRFKREAMSAAYKEIDAKMRRVKAAQRLNDFRKRKEMDQSRNQQGSNNINDIRTQQNQSQNQQQNQANNNQGVA